MYYSKNPLTNEVYQIPEEINDKQKIDRFLALNKGKSVVVIQGLGFVGSVMSLVCANSKVKEYAVIGVDLATESNYWKICALNSGTFPLSSSDEKVYKFYENARTQGNFYATYDPYAYEVADIIIVDINLDVEKKSDEENNLSSFDVNLEDFKSAVKTIADRCKEEILVLVETTVPPGACMKIVKPILESGLKDRNMSIEKYYLGHSYERVMPGPDYIDSIKNFFRVYSGIDDRSADAVEDFLHTIISTSEYPLTRLGSTNATEIAKVLENSYRAMNIAFVVEWSRFAEEANVNLYEIVEAIRLRPTHKNLMFPGIGVGGYCLTKDPLLASWSRMNIFNSNESLSQSEKAVEINDKMPLYAFLFILENVDIDIHSKKILLLGVSYRGDVGDTRFTPVGPLYDKLVKNDCDVCLHDPFISHWDEKGVSVYTQLDSVIENEFDMIIICANHSLYRDNNVIRIINEMKAPIIIDTIGLLSESQINSLSFEHKVKVLGRGDL